MSNLKKKKKGADDPPVNNNRSDHNSSKSATKIVGSVDSASQKKGSKGKR
jgi:hypothetical protein